MCFEPLSRFSAISSRMFLGKAPQIACHGTDLFIIAGQRLVKRVLHSFETCKGFASDSGRNLLKGAFQRAFRLDETRLHPISNQIFHSESPRHLNLRAKPYELVQSSEAYWH